jgi:medium-chain acyl-[acyl-carrier-protein] hydrolase
MPRRHAHEATTTAISTWRTSSSSAIAVGSPWPADRCWRWVLVVQISVWNENDWFDWSSTVRTDWLVRPRPKSTAAMRMFCFPHAGGGASAYRGWAENMAGEIDLCYIQLPGRENRLAESPFTALEPLADLLATALAPWLDRPYIFYGHSFGAIVAFEIARELRRRGFAEPEHLFMSASRAPHLRWPHPPIGQLTVLDLLHEVHRRYDAVPAEIFEDVELQELFVPALRADLTMLETYRYSPERPLRCGITVFGGRQDPMVDTAALDGWRNHTEGEFQVHLLEGGHMLLQTGRVWLLEMIADRIDALIRGGTGNNDGRSGSLRVSLYSERLGGSA